MIVNNGMFRQNGSCGYVLKPTYMRQPGMHPHAPIRLSIHFMSAAQLPKPGGATTGEIIDPFILAEVHSLGPSQRFTSAVVNNNGFDPMWNEKAEFDIAYPDTAILTIKVMDADIASAEFVAYCSYPVLELRQGVRVMQLWDGNDSTEGDFNFAALYVRISLQSVIPTTDSRSSIPSYDSMMHPIGENSKENESCEDLNFTDTLSDAE